MRQNVAMLGHLPKQPHELPKHRRYASMEVGDEVVVAAWSASLPNRKLAGRFVLNNYAVRHHSEPVTMNADKNTTLKPTTSTNRLLMAHRKQLQLSNLL